MLNDFCHLYAKSHRKILGGMELVPVSLFDELFNGILQIFHASSLMNALLVSLRSFTLALLSESSNHSTQ